MIFLGINSSSLIHFGNYVSIIKPIIKFNKKRFFIADLHSICKCFSFDNLIINKKVIFSTFLTFFKKNLCFYQSDNKILLYVYWILSCFYNKKKIKFLHIVKNNTFLSIAKICYPILMISDIFCNNNTFIFLGFDQIQHIELVKKIFKKIKKFLYFKKKIKFVINNNTLYSYDKKKMSKSLKNDIFLFSNFFQINNFINKFKFTLKKKKSLLNFYINLIGKNLINFFFKNNYINFKKKVVKYIYFNFFYNKKYFFNIIKNLDYLNYFKNISKKYFEKNIKKNYLYINKIINL